MKLEELSKIEITHIVYSDLTEVELASIFRECANRMGEISKYRDCKIAECKQKIEQFYVFLREKGHIIEHHGNIEKSKYEGFIQFMKMWACIDWKYKERKQFYTYGFMLCRMAANETWTK
jgi:hypothetical protein